MKLQDQKNRFYLFLRDRDALLIEFFFLCLNIYILALVLLPPYTNVGFELYWRMFLQTFVTGINIAAIVKPRRIIRIISSSANAAIMAFISIALFIADNPSVGTYSLLAVLAMFVCWKISIRQ